MPMTEALCSLVLVSTLTIVSWKSHARIVLFMSLVNVKYKFTSACLVLSAVLCCEEYIINHVPTCCSN